MNITLIIGPTDYGTARFRTILKKKRALLAKHSVFSPEWNHIRIHMACASNSEIGLVRFQRGFASIGAQEALFQHLQAQVGAALTEHKPEHFVISSGQLGALMYKKSELERLKSFFEPFGGTLKIVAYVDEPARVLTQHYEKTVMDGRRTPLDVELSMVGTSDWWSAAQERFETPEPHFAVFNDLNAPPPWLDYTALIAHWRAVFGHDAVEARALNMAHLSSENGAEELNAVLGTDIPVGTLEDDPQADPPSTVTLARTRQLNDVYTRFMQARGLSMPLEMRKRLTYPHRAKGIPTDPGSLSEISEHFKEANDALTKEFKGLPEGWCEPPKPAERWHEPDLQNGFRASQWLSANSFFIQRHATPIAELAEQTEALEKSAKKVDAIIPEDAELEDKFRDKNSKDHRKDFLEMFKVNHSIVLSTHITPHNKMGQVNEEKLEKPYSDMPARQLPPGSSGNVIVGCMKNEAPYIIEWVAYHRAIGFDNFIIYTNACEDGTTELLDRLQEMGVLQHRDNNKWRGKSPQQYALNQSLEEPVIQNAEWIAHIDVDEFINIRTGNGTVDDLLKATGGATNIAMTWRLFGHNDVHKLNDDLVIEQFDTCAPKFCPKPHTVWGFKSMFKNLNAYRKISCHRPNQIIDEKREAVKWVNGSGHDVTEKYIKGGWRSDKKTVGYDLVQLNHYALRSAESFLIKRQRGRALHVDRSIGLNYWIRMDWSDHKDVTIKRNIPRVQAEYDRLMQDEKLKAIHEAGLKWHRAKVASLHETEEFQELYAQALKVQLDAAERVAYSLALDMDS